ncbi:hypothetical protein LZ32DRAFT_661577 [Colletotrichum eremochloae]|nr:hypothetical protein LZ32DRAFT_661577 [Colletotrichum eremochloae]
MPQGCEELVNQAKDPDSVASEMMTAVIELRKKLTEYRTTRRTTGAMAYDGTRSESVTMVAGIISTILAAILLIEAIVGFSYVTVWGAKLSMICAFTTAFALSAGMTTSAKRAEIFAATAAYAAVLVVFVSNGDLSRSQCYSAPE